ncbi:MAG: MIP/aquaporin family protein [Verrucomicrobiota bacterium]
MNAFLGEVVGTMVLIIFGCGVCAGNSLTGSFAKGGGWLMGCVAWGIAVMLGVLAAGGNSSGHLNPAVTLGFAAIGEFPWKQVPTYIAGQFVGAFLGAVIVFLHYLPHWGKTEDAGTKLGVFSTSPAVPQRFSNLISEGIGTAVLIFGLLCIGGNDFTEGLKPLIVGLLVATIGMCFGGTTGYAINPARDLAPRIAHFVLPIPGKGDSNWSYAWVPVIGPIVGGILGGLAYLAYSSATAPEVDVALSRISSL